MTIINGNYREYKLDNGLVVALQNTPTETISAELRVNYSPSYEKEGEEGLAHFLEHCLITSGSLKYDPITIDKIRGSFGNSNGFTNVRGTSFVCQMLSEDLESWMDYISDSVFRSRFDLERVNGERKRVLQEISDAKSDPFYSAKMEFSNTLYRGHPKGRFLLGKEDAVKNASLESIRMFHNNGYHSNNADLIIVGKLPENIEELIKNNFENIQIGNNTRKKFPELDPLDSRTIIHRPASERINIDNPDESSAQIYLYYTGPITGHADEHAVRVANQILGGDTNSLLFQNLGLKKGLAYFSTTRYDGDYNFGDLGVEALVPARKIEEAVDAIFEEINRMRTEKITYDSLNRVKKLAKYSFAKNMELNEGCINFIETKLDYGLIPELYYKGFDKVTPEMIIEVANKYFPDKETGHYVLYIRNPLIGD